VSDVDDTTGQGRRILTAVERLVDDADNLIAQVEGFKLDLAPRIEHGDAEHQRDVAQRLVASYSTRSAIAGGVTAMPGLLPGGGTVVAVVGGSLVDMTFMLKHEVEMVLCLTHLYGHDIRDERERWLAYVLAAVHTYEVKSGRNYFVDLAEVQIEALAKYTPRQLSKLAIAAVGKVAVLSATRGIVKGLPLIGIAVSASANKMLTRSVGWRCMDALACRAAEEHAHGGVVVDAVVT